MPDPIFCTNCGKSVDSVDVFCPGCGAAVKGGPADVAMKEMYKKATKQTITWAGVFLLVASLPSIIIGLDAIFNSASIATDMWNSLSDTLGMSFDELVGFIRDYGFIELAIGLLGVLGAVLCFMKRFWIVVLIITVVIIFLGVLSFFGLFLGLLALWFVLFAKSGFQEYAKK